MKISDNELIFILKGVSLTRIKYRPRYSQIVSGCE
jgi:hypothetical protein